MHQHGMLHHSMIDHTRKHHPVRQHALVFAYTQAGDVAGAWTAARRGHASGALLMAESYVLLIHGHMQVRHMLHGCKRELAKPECLRPSACSSGERVAARIHCRYTGGRGSQEAACKQPHADLSLVSARVRQHHACQHITAPIHIRRGATSHATANGGTPATRAACTHAVANAGACSQA